MGPTNKMTSKAPSRFFVAEEPPSSGEPNAFVLVKCIESFFHALWHIVVKEKVNLVAYWNRINQKKVRNS